MPCLTKGPGEFVPQMAVGHSPNVDVPRACVPVSHRGEVLHRIAGVFEIIGCEISGVAARTAGIVNKDRSVRCPHTIAAEVGRVATVHLGRNVKVVDAGDGEIPHHSGMEAWSVATENGDGAVGWREQSCATDEGGSLDPPIASGNPEQMIAGGVDDEPVMPGPQYEVIEVLVVMDQDRGDEPDLARASASVNRADPHPGLQVGDGDHFPICQQYPGAGGEAFPAGACAHERTDEGGGSVGYFAGTSRCSRSANCYRYWNNDAGDLNDVTGETPDLAKDGVRFDTGQIVPPVSECA